jgi:hypothetical protein
MLGARVVNAIHPVGRLCAATRRSRLLKWQSAVIHVKGRSVRHRAAHTSTMDEEARNDLTARFIFYVYVTRALDNHVLCTTDFGGMQLSPAEWLRGITIFATSSFVSMGICFCLALMRLCNVAKTPVYAAVFSMLHGLWNMAAIVVVAAITVFTGADPSCPRTDVYQCLLVQFILGLIEIAETIVVWYMPRWLASSNKHIVCLSAPNLNHSAHKDGPRRARRPWHESRQGCWQDPGDARHTHRAGHWAGRQHHP